MAKKIIYIYIYIYLHGLGHDENKCIHLESGHVELCGESLSNDVGHSTQVICGVDNIVSSGFICCLH